MFLKHRTMSLSAVLGVLFCLGAIQASDKYWVEVTVKELSIIDRMSEVPDPYVIFNIDGIKLKTKRLDDKRTATPNWSFGTIIDGSKITGRDGIRIAMALKDYDSTSRDDNLDINPAKKRKDLDLRLHLDPRAASGSKAGEICNEAKQVIATLTRVRPHCWSTSTIRMTGAGDDNRSRIDFTIEVMQMKRSFIHVPIDQPQNDDWSCGPNSISRVLRSYGIDAPYSKVRSFTKRDGNLVSLAGLGAPPSALIDAFRHWKRDAKREDTSHTNRIVELLQDRKPVVVLISTKKNSNGVLGSTGKLHYLVINGYDPQSDMFDYVNTSGATGKWSRAELEHRWNWQNHFTGIGGESAQGGLEALGLRKRTLFY